MCAGQAGSSDGVDGSSPDQAPGRSMGTVLSEAVERLRVHRTIKAWRWRGMELYELTEFRENWILRALSVPQSKLMQLKVIWNTQVDVGVCLLTKRVKEVLEEISRKQELNAVVANSYIFKATSDVSASREEYTAKIKKFRMKKIWLLSAFLQQVTLKD